MKYKRGNWVAVGSFISLLAIHAQPVYAVVGDGKIIFSGKLVAETCTISVNNVAGNNVTIVLPKVSRSNMGEEGSTKGGTGFTFKLTNCTGSTVTKARVFFQDGIHVNSDGTLGNMITSHGATGVALQLYDAAMNPVQVGDPSQMNEAATPFGGLMGYSVRYVATSDAVGSGQFSTTVTYLINYE